MDPSIHTTILKRVVETRETGASRLSAAHIPTPNKSSRFSGLGGPLSPSYEIPAVRRGDGGIRS